MHLFGDNGIISNAQNANVKNGMAALEEWLQEEYVKYYEDEDNYINKLELLNAKRRNLFLKDGIRNYIIKEGKVYYLINKSSLPKEIKDGLIGGNTTEYAKYIRLQDVYGVTENLKVYYCDADGNNAYGEMVTTDVDPTLPANKINRNGGMKDAITLALSEIGVSVDPEKGITISNASQLDTLEIDGNKTPITSLSGLEELKGVTKLTLSNLGSSSLYIPNLEGIEGLSELNFILFRDCYIEDYSNLENCWDLQYMYMYMSSKISEFDSNNQVINLGNGLKDANNLKKFEYFGISGYEGALLNSKTYSNPKVWSGGLNALGDITDVHSNVSSLGDFSLKTGLAKFNSNIKSSLKYVFLNNNNLSDINVLSDFSGIIILNLFQNKNLSNISSLQNHSILEILTMQNCNITSLSALKGCSNLKKLSIHDNANLNSLEGIEDCTFLNNLIAYNCNLTDIDSLKNHSLISVLDLAFNLNLVKVSYIQHCKNLVNIYLDSNESMTSTSLDEALNGTNEEYGTTVLIANCSNGYQNIPQKYWTLFTATSSTPDLSYAALGKYLTDDSPEWVKMKNKTNVTRLKLDNQNQLSNKSLNETLATMTKIECLRLKGCSKLSSLEFVSSQTKLVYLDIRSVSNTLTDISVLNSSNSLKTLVFDNSNMVMSGIQDLISRLSISANFERSGYFGGLMFNGDATNLSFSECTRITKIVLDYRSSGIQGSGTLDLTPCTSLSSIRVCGSGYSKIIVPPSCVNYFGNTDSSYSVPKIERLVATPLFVTVYTEWHKQEELEKISEFWTKSAGGNVLGSWFSSPGSAIFNAKTLENVITASCFADNTPYFNSDIVGRTFTKLETLSLGQNKLTTSVDLTPFPNLTELIIAGASKLNSLTNIPSSLSKLTINSSAFGSLEFIKNLKSLTYVELTSCNFTDLSPLLDTIITNETTGVKSITYAELDLSNNKNMDGYTYGNNIEVLLKLHAAGLEKVYLTGTKFSENEINELVSGKTIGSVTYAGFGIGNVVK